MIIAEGMIIDHQRSMIMTWGYEHWSLWSLIMLIHTWMCCSYYDRLLIMGDDMLIIAMNRLWSCMINDIFMSSWTLSWTLPPCFLSLLLSSVSAFPPSLPKIWGSQFANVCWTHEIIFEVVEHLSNPHQSKTKQHKHIFADWFFANLERICSIMGKLFLIRLLKIENLVTFLWVPLQLLCGKLQVEQMFLHRCHRHLVCKQTKCI